MSTIRRFSAFYVLLSFAFSSVGMEEGHNSCETSDFLAALLSTYSKLPNNGNPTQVDIAMFLLANSVIEACSPDATPDSKNRAFAAAFNSDVCQALIKQMTSDKSLLGSDSEQDHRRDGNGESDEQDGGCD